MTANEVIHMSKNIPIEIKVIDDQLYFKQHIVSISEALAKELHIQHKQTYYLTCGRNSQEIQTVCIKESDPILYCSSTLLKSLMLPQETFTISLTKIKENILSLGPILSLITEIKVKPDHISLGSIEDFCLELARYCNQRGIFFYLTTLNLFKENTGYIYPNQDWKRTNVPLPHVVHNRIHSRKKEQTIEFQHFTTFLQENQIPFFNHHFLNKWEVHEILEKEDHILPYLPDTKLLLNKQALEDSLVLHSCVFLKPIHGSQGRKIFKIIRSDEGHYELDYTSFAGEIEQKYETFQSLFSALRSRLNKSAYIVQQGIPLLTFENRPLDFRYLCQRLDSHHWQVTSSVARVSAKEDFVSNLSRGGELKKIDEVLSTKFDSKTIKQIKKMMRELAIEVSSIIGAAAEGVFGELGIDLALDPEGKPWLIEVNTKPSKNQDPAHLSKKIRPSAKAIIEHCIYLANFPHEE